MWCKKCNKMLQPTDSTRIERIKSDVNKMCPNRALMTMITEMFSPAVFNAATKVFKGKFASSVDSAGLAF